MNSDVNCVMMIRAILDESVCAVAGDHNRTHKAQLLLEVQIIRHDGRMHSSNVLGVLLRGWG